MRHVHFNEVETGGYHAPGCICKLLHYERQLLRFEVLDFLSPATASDLQKVYDLKTYLHLWVGIMEEINKLSQFRGKLVIADSQIE